MWKIEKQSKYGYLELSGDPESIWFTSDPHYDHKNIIRLCNRPFGVPEEPDLLTMNAALIINWNNVVKEDDLVFILGDFCWSGDHARWERLLTQLNGKKILIIGNHDDRKVLEKIEHCFLLIRERLELRINGSRLMLDHFPQQEWNGSWHGVYHLFGHIHEKPGTDKRSYNVSVERNNYRPINYQEVEYLLTKQMRDDTSGLSINDI